MGLLENAAEWLESQRIRELSVPIVYQRRDGETLNIPALVDNRNGEFPDPLGFQPFGCVLQQSHIIRWR